MPDMSPPCVSGSFPALARASGRLFIREGNSVNHHAAVVNNTRRLMPAEVTDPRAKLQAFVGTWAGTEKIQTSLWGLGGIAMSSMAVHMDLEGRAFIMDYAQRRDGKATHRVHAIITVGGYENQLHLFWFDDLGYVPQAAPGYWERDRLFFMRRSGRGLVRHCYSLIGTNACQFRLDGSIDGGRNWTAVLQADYLRG
jgi:hypothetical protein